MANVREGGGGGGGTEMFVGNSRTAIKRAIRVWFYFGTIFILHTILRPIDAKFFNGESAIDHDILLPPISRLSRGNESQAIKRLSA